MKNIVIQTLVTSFFLSFLSVICLQQYKKLKLLAALFLQLLVSLNRKAFQFNGCNWNSSNYNLSFNITYRVLFKTIKIMYNLSISRDLLVGLFIMILSGINADAQQDIYSNIKQLVPASPTTAAFAKYGEYQVSQFTGVPGISIPLYEIKTKNFSVPINLTYHASGIKVAEVAGSVGSGWVINTGGRISRFTKGQNDQYKPRDVRGAYTLDVSNNADFDYVENIYKGYSDAEPDEFRYDFLNYSGKFLFGKNNKPILIPYCPLKVKLIPISVYSSDIEINNENGDIFSFEHDDSKTVVSPSSSFYTGQTGWLLSSMKDKNSTDSIIYSYQSTGNGTLSEQSVDVIQFLDGFNKSGINCSFSENLIGSASSYTVSTTGSEYVFKTITFENGKVIFYLSNDNRLDALGSFKYMKKIEVYDNSIAIPIKTIQFYHSYFVNQIGPNTYKRLKLDSLTISGNTPEVIQRYKFDYNTQTKLPEYSSKMRDYWGYFNNRSNTSLIPKMTLQLAAAGPYSTTIGTSDENGFEPNPDVNQSYILKKIYYPTGGYTEFTYETNKFLNNNNVEKYAGGLRVTEITSNDGKSNVISKKYKYGINENGLGRLNAFFGNDKYISNKVFLNCTSYSSASDAKNCSGNSWNVSSELQNSLSSTDGSPVVYEYVTEYIEGKNQKSKILYRFNDVPDNYTSSTSYDKNLIVDNSYKRGMLIEKTISYQTGGISKLVSRLINNYTYFTDTADYSLAFKVVKSKDYVCDRYDSQRDFYNFFNYPIRYGDNLLKFTEEYTYDSGDDSKYMYSKKLYDYNNRKDCQISKIQYFDSKGITQIKTYKYSTDYPPAPLPPVSTCESEKQTCINTATTQRDLRLAECNQITEPSTRATCTSHYISTYDNAIIQCQRNFVACQNNYDNSIQSDQRAITEMQTKNMINRVIEEQALQTTPNNTTTLTGGTINKFTKQNGLIVPAEVYSLEINSPSTNLNRSSFNSSGSLIPPTDYHKKLTYDKYDIKGNILQYHKSDDVNTAFLWSYNGSFPVVKGINVTYDILNAAVIAAGATNLETFFSSFNNIATDASLQTTWKIFNTALRNNVSLANVEVTTYTYSPLIGMTSQTDPNGVTTYFEYDGFGRLKNVKDKDQNILKNNQYHYYNN